MLRIDVETVEEGLKNLVGEAVVVEGKRDKKVLKSLGFKRVYDISGKPLEDFVDRVAEEEREIIILTDFDKEGRALAARLVRLFESRDVKVKKEERMKFHKLFPQFKKIEEIRFFLKVIKEDDHHGEISAINRKIHNRTGIHSRWGGRKT
ncbi:MAG: toprim domain-containing protein [Candidatus Aenigmarchaeota archaeon]|nr:toprim domain-containing protein [Candidatus Aenigmarchaeota archaeon]